MNCRIAMQRTATGLDLGKGPIEVCAGGGIPFPRGAQRNAVEGRNDDRTKLGWICDECVFPWRHTGRAPAGLSSDEEEDAAEENHPS